MGLKTLLENPTGGQVFSAYVVLSAAISLVLFITYNLIAQLLRGEPVEINRDGIGFVLLAAGVIPALVKFVRSRHAR